MDGCSFEGNGIGVLAGEGVHIDMKNSKFIDNGTAIVVGKIDSQIIAALKTLPLIERAKIVGELDEISREPSVQRREEIIKRSTLANKLSVIANFAVVSDWVSGLVTGADAHQKIQDFVSNLLG